MNTTADARTNADIVDADRFRLAQAAELQIRFREVEGRAANSKAELSARVARSDIEEPVVPWASLLAPYLD